MYFKIIIALNVVMALYYAVMIFLDIRAQKAKEALASEKDPETEIDISDEASSFKPTYISRDEKPMHENVESVDSDRLESGDDSSEESEISEVRQGFRRPDYREAIMTDGIIVEELIEEIDDMAENGSSDLGQVIHVWDRA